MGVCRRCWGKLTGFAWHEAQSGDIFDGEPTGPYCYDCVPKDRPPWRHRIPRPGEETLARLEAEARRHLGRRFSWVHLGDDPLTGERSLTINGLPQPEQSTLVARLTAGPKSIRISCPGAENRPPQELSMPIVTEPALVIAQVGVLVTMPKVVPNSRARLLG